MRPVKRGLPPVVNGKAKTFNKYTDARDDLIAAIGDFCSYCEVALHADVDVEHVRPKIKYPHLQLSWENFLLACKYCNTVKGDKHVRLTKVFWPDRDNTARAFVYTQGGVINANPALRRTRLICAKRTIKMIGLDRTPATHPYSHDRRWGKRKDAWEVAVESLNDLKINDTQSMRRQIVRTAISRGFWSIWMTVFAADKDMLQRFIDAFPGTSLECFKKSCCFKKRPNGLL